MAENLGISLNLHMRDETKVSAVRVPSSGDDFVSLEFKSGVSVLMFNSAQAKAVATAAADAYHLLKTIELEKEREEMARAWEDRGPLLPDFGYNDEECSDANPCQGCQDELNDYQDAYEPF